VSGLRAGLHGVSGDTQTRERYGQELPLYELWAYSVVGFYEFEGMVEATSCPLEKTSNMRLIFPLHGLLIEA